MYIQRRETHIHKCSHPNISIMALGPKEANQYGLSDWSLKSMQTQEDSYRQHGLAIGLRRVLQSMRVRRAYAPNVVMASAVVVNARVLDTRIKLGGDVCLYRKKQVPADAVFVPSGRAFVASGAGCPFIVATADEHMIVAHAGRDSLIERSAVLGTPAREHPSIVNAIIEAFDKKGFPANRISMSMYLAIPASVFEHRFDHPFCGEYNRALARFVDDRWPGCTVHRKDSMFLDLESVFIEQARAAGLRHAWATLSLDTCPGLVHTRGGENRQRNLIVIKNDTVSSSCALNGQQDELQEVHA